VLIFRFSDYGKETLTKVINFVENECIPAEATFHAQIPHDKEQRWKVVPSVMEDLKKKAKAQGLWNLFLSKKHYPKHGMPLSNLEYGVMCEIMGRSISIAPQAMNCSAPDTGNMEVFAKYGTEAQQKRWLEPLLKGEIRSSFAMTEKGISSSDAKNISGSIVQDGDEIVINAHKQWISGAGDPRNGIHIVVGKSDPTNKNSYLQQSIVLVPANTPGVKLVRPMTVFGYDDAPEGHFEVKYENVRVPKENLVAGWGRGFEVLQGRLGPGRLHHCMRGIGVAGRALDAMIERATDPKRKTFGKQMYEHGTVVADIAHARIAIDQCRWLVLSAANQVDAGDAKSALKEISEAKIAVFTAVQHVIDRAMQVHGGEGIDGALPLAYLWAMNRTLRYADGPDEVHIMQLGKSELKNSKAIHEKAARIRGLTEKSLKQYNVKLHL